MKEITIAILPENFETASAWFDTNYPQDGGADMIGAADSTGKRISHGVFPDAMGTAILAQFPTQAFEGVMTITEGVISVAETPIADTTFAERETLNDSDGEPITNSAGVPYYTDSYIPTDATLTDNDEVLISDASTGEAELAEAGDI